jgi:hypothetical protein
LFSELSLRLQSLTVSKPLENFNLTAIKNDNDSKALQRALAIFEQLNTIKLRETDDLCAMLHYRLVDDFSDYQLADLIGACQLMQSNQDEFTLKTLNKKACLKHEDEVYLYRRKKVVKNKMLTTHE